MYKIISVLALMTSMTYVYASSTFSSLCSGTVTASAGTSSGSVSITCNGDVTPSGNLCENGGCSSSATSSSGSCSAKVYCSGCTGNGTAGAGLSCSYDVKATWTCSSDNDVTSMSKSVSDTHCS